MKAPHTVGDAGLDALTRALLVNAGGARTLQHLQLHSAPGRCTIGDASLQRLSAALLCRKPLPPEPAAAPVDDVAAFLGLQDRVVASDGAAPPAAEQGRCALAGAAAPRPEERRDGAGPSGGWYVAAPMLCRVDVAGGEGCATHVGLHAIEAARRARRANVHAPEGDSTKPSTVEGGEAAARAAAKAAEKMPASLRRFLQAFEWTERDAEHRQRRDTLWQSFDGNGNGRISLAEAGGGILATLTSRDGPGGTAVYRRYYRSCAPRPNNHPPLTGPPPTFSPLPAAIPLLPRGTPQHACRHATL